jgi:phosphopantetheinyl transferase
MLDGSNYAAGIRTVPGVVCPGEGWMVSVRMPGVDVWWVSLDDDMWSLRAELTAEEHEQATGYLCLLSRRRYEQRRRALRAILSQYVNRTPDVLRFDRYCGHCGDEYHGKPVLCDFSDSIFFNVSSAADLAVIAVSASFDIGVDIETPALHEGALDESYVAHWTRYEALMKGTGKGIVDFPGFANPQMHPAKPHDWTIVDLPRVDGTVGALALHSFTAAIAVHHLDRRREPWLTRS